MQTEEDYKKILGRLRETLPETVTAQSRFKVPELEVLYEGKTTVLRKGRIGSSDGMTFMASSCSLKRLSQGNT